MLKTISGFIKSKRGNLVENIIYLIIIGGMAYTFYSDKVQTPMNANMDSINDKISTWTTVEE